MWGRSKDGSLDVGPNWKAWEVVESAPISSSSLGAMVGKGVEVLTSELACRMQKVVGYR